MGKFRVAVYEHILPTPGIQQSKERIATDETFLGYVALDGFDPAAMSSLKDMPDEMWRGKFGAFTVDKDNLHVPKLLRGKTFHFEPATDKNRPNFSEESCPVCGTSVNFACREIIDSQVADSWVCPCCSESGTNWSEIVFAEQRIDD